MSSLLGYLLVLVFFSMSFSQLYPPAVECDERTPCPAGQHCMPPIAANVMGICSNGNRRFLLGEPAKQCYPDKVPTRCASDEYCAKSTMEGYSGFCLKKPEGSED